MTTTFWKKTGVLHKIKWLQNEVNCNLSKYIIILSLSTQKNIVLLSDDMYVSEKCQNANMQKWLMHLTIKAYIWGCPSVRLDFSATMEIQHDPGQRPWSNAAACRQCWTSCSCCRRLSLAGQTQTLILSFKWKWSLYFYPRPLYLYIHLSAHKALESPLKLIFNGWAC